MLELLEENERPIFSVSDLVTYLRVHVEEDPVLSQVWVRGEISNFHHHHRGHMYFTLKDEGSKIRAVMFAGNNRRLRFVPKDGDDVLVRGYLSVYERDGQVQLYVQEMQPNGVGELYAAFQQLKERLEQEGLFDPAHKKPLPFYPRRVGVVTAPGGAVIRDIITTIRRRSPNIHILLHPVPVQGDGAARAIAAAVDALNEWGEVDVIIVGRGGGSLEELWAFNEEVVAQSIFRSRIPVVSAVGHETDVTIADFVADVRAATPTAAAEQVSPRWEELHDRLTACQHRLVKAMQRRLQFTRDRLERLKKRSGLRQPGTRLIQYEQRLDDLVHDLLRAMASRLRDGRRNLEQQAYRLWVHRPAERIREFRAQLQQWRKVCVFHMKQRCRVHRAEWERLVDQLDALSPLRVMRRGYALVYRYRGEDLIRSVRQVNPGDLLDVRIADGRLQCQVWKKEESADGGGE